MLRHYPGLREPIKPHLSCVVDQNPISVTYVLLIGMYDKAMEIGSLYLLSMLYICPSLYNGLGRVGQTN